MSFELLCTIIQREVRGLALSLRYRKMQFRRKWYHVNFVVGNISTHDQISMSRHPNGYDKLKALGLPIHGKIDEVSRQIIWLKERTTNNNPTIIVTIYIFQRLF